MTKTETPAETITAMRSPEVSGRWAGATDAEQVALLNAAHAEAIEEDSLRTRRHPHPNGGTCWTHKNCEAREALAKLQAWAADKDDPALHALIDEVAAAIPEPL